MLNQMKDQERWRETNKTTNTESTRRRPRYAVALSSQVHIADLMKSIVHLIADVFNPCGIDQLPHHGLDTVLGLVTRMFKKFSTGHIAALLQQDSQDSPLRVRQVAGGGVGSGGSGRETPSSCTLPA